MAKLGIDTRSLSSPSLSSALFPHPHDHHTTCWMVLVLIPNVELCRSVGCLIRFFFIYFIYLWPIDCCIYQVCLTKIPCSAHIVHLCVFYHSQNEKWFFLSTDWHIWSCWSVFSAWYIASTVSFSQNKKQYCTYIWNSCIIMCV